MRFRCPPYFGAWADAGAAPATAAASPRDITSATMRVERVMVLVSLIRLLGRNGNSRMVAGKPSQNIRHRRWSDNPSTDGVMHCVKAEHEAGPGRTVAGPGGRPEMAPAGRPIDAGGLGRADPSAPADLAPREDLLEGDGARPTAAAELRPDEDRPLADAGGEADLHRPLGVEPLQREAHQRAAPVVAELALVDLRAHAVDAQVRVGELPERAATDEASDEVLLDGLPGIRAQRRERRSARLPEVPDRGTAVRRAEAGRCPAKRARRRGRCDGRYGGASRQGGHENLLSRSGDEEAEYMLQHML